MLSTGLLNTSGRSGALRCSPELGPPLVGTQWCESLIGTHWGDLLSADFGAVRTSLEDVSPTQLEPLDEATSADMSSLYWMPARGSSEPDIERDGQRERHTYGGGLRI